MKEWFIEYFTIPRKERVGIIALGMLIGMVWFIPYLWKTAEKADAKYYFSKAKQISTPAINPVAKLFVFDPNTISDADWLSFGVPERSVYMIRNYLNKGGRFRKPEALMNIYGMDTNIAKTLIPYMKISETTTLSFKKSDVNLDVNSIDPKFRKPTQKAITILDINLADSASLESLPWIGEKLASRIIKFRDACGGLYTIDQIAGIYGVSDTAFLHFRSYLRIGKKGIRKLNINTDPADSLARHPYMQYRQAKALVAYRNQHGSIKNVQDLLSIPVFDQAWLDKIEPYLSL